MLLAKEVRLLADLTQLRGRGLTNGIRLFHAHARLLAQACNTHHEKFVEVRSGNGKEFQAFKQRILLFIRFLQHTLIKGEPAQLPVGVGDVRAFYLFVVFFTHGATSF